MFETPDLYLDLKRAILIMGVCSGGKMGICPPLEIGTKSQKYLENLKSEA